MLYILLLSALVILSSALPSLSLKRHVSLDKSPSSCISRTYTESSAYSHLTMIRGGGSVPGGKDKSIATSSCGSLFRSLLGIWGVLQVVAIIGNALKRVIPIALQPFSSDVPLSGLQWTSYGLWTVYMMYTEGYKAFQLKFSPLVVKRAFGLSENFNALKFLLAGPYAMGLFGATKKRMIISWSVSAGVASIVAIVKKLGYPYRSIIDGGVVAGLTYGTLSILALTVNALRGNIPDIDPELSQ